MHGLRQHLIGQDDGVDRHRLDIWIALERLQIAAVNGRGHGVEAPMIRFYRSATSSQAIKRTVDAGRAAATIRARRMYFRHGLFSVHLIELDGSVTIRDRAPGRPSDSHSTPTRAATKPACLVGSDANELVCNNG